MLPYKKVQERLIYRIILKFLVEQGQISPNKILNVVIKF